MYCVYEHLRADTREPFYIGKGTLKRPFSKRNRNKHWHNIKNKYGIIINILQEFENEEEALKKERTIELEYREKGFKLCNIIECGKKGYETKGWHHTEKTKQKMSLFHKNRIRTLEERKKVSEAQKKRYLDSEQREILKMNGLKYYEKAKKPVIQKDKNGNFVKEWRSAVDVQKELGIFATSVTACCRKRKNRISYKGFKWEYKNV